MTSITIRAKADRRRAGRRFPKGVEIEIVEDDLTAEDIAALEADPLLVVAKGAPSAAASKDRKTTKKAGDKPAGVNRRSEVARQKLLVDVAMKLKAGTDWTAETIGNDVTDEELAGLRSGRLAAIAPGLVKDGDTSLKAATTAAGFIVTEDELRTALEGAQTDNT